MPVYSLKDWCAVPYILKSYATPCKYGKIHIMRLVFKIPNFKQIIPGIIILISSILILLLTVKTGYFKNLMLYVNKGTSPDTMAIIFSSVNLVRFLLLILSAIVIFIDGFNTCQILGFAILIEGIGLISNYFIATIPATQIWNAVNFFPLPILLITNFINKKGYLYDTLEGRLPSNDTISMLIQDKGPEPAYTPFNSYSFLNRHFHNRSSLKPIIFILLLLGGIAWGIHHYRDRLIHELNFFISRTNFLSKTGLDKILKKAGISFPLKTKSFKGKKKSDHYATYLKNKKNRSIQLRKKFSNRVHSRKVLKKKTSHYEIGHAFLSKGNYYRAVNEFKKALNEPLPKYSKMLTHYFLAKTYENNLNDDKQALKHWLTLKKMPPHNVKFQMNLPVLAIKEVKRLKNKIKKTKYRTR